MSDLLEQATRALRETTSEREPRSGLTRARILDGAQKRYASRRGGVLRWAIVAAAALATSTALARVVEHWPEIKRAIAPVFGVQVEGPKPAPVRKRVQRSVPPPPRAEAPAVPRVEPETPPQPIAAPEPVVDAGAPAARAHKPLQRAARKPAPAPAPSEVVPPPAEPAPAVVTLTPAPSVEPADLALFRRAQRLHLNRDSRALAAWDDYLRVAGQGALAPEARYNRALCLIRLGRASEAKQALRPFADGAYGSFRQSDAKALLDALQ